MTAFRLNNAPLSFGGYVSPDILSSGIVHKERSPSIIDALISAGISETHVL